MKGQHILYTWTRPKQCEGKIDLFCRKAFRSSTSAKIYSKRMAGVTIDMLQVHLNGNFGGKMHGVAESFTDSVVVVALESRCSSFPSCITPSSSRFQLQSRLRPPRMSKISTFLAHTGVCAEESRSLPAFMLKEQNHYRHLCWGNMSITSIRTDRIRLSQSFVLKDQSKSCGKQVAAEGH